MAVSKIKYSPTPRGAQIFLEGGEEKLKLTDFLIRFFFYFAYGFFELHIRQ